MNQKPIITLTTDFGTRDPYAAAMKGVILSICRSAKIVDLTHKLDSFNIHNCSRFLAETIPFFPDGSIHVIVVDPGVGSKRNPIVVLMADKYFVCPDNGVLTLLIKDSQAYKAYRITNNKFWMPYISNTFHGRDIFAPVAAHLANGCKLEELGEPINKLVTLNTNEPVKDQYGNIIGEIVYIDGFGNCISNIHMKIIKNYKNIKINNIELSGIKDTYKDEQKGMLSALWGSSGYLEVAVNMGSAEKLFNIKMGDKIIISS